MKKYFEILKKAKPFSGFSDDQIEIVLRCLSARVKRFEKGELIIATGEKVPTVAVLLDGAAHVYSDDIDGNRNIYAKLGAGDMFGEVFAIAGAKSAVNAEAAASCEALLFNFSKSHLSCRKCGQCLAEMLKDNMMMELAYKNIALSEKLSCVGRRSIREKVYQYLALQRIKHGSSTFEVPLSRAEMADYLCVDRSALSAVLSRLQQEGLIRFKRNRFTIL